MNKNKRKILSLMITLIMIIILNTSVKATETRVIQAQIDHNGAIIEISSDKKITSVKMYKKDSNGVYTRFYQSTQAGYTEKKFFISKYSLSEEEKTDIRVDITYDGESNEVKEIEIDKVPEQVINEPTPSETPASPTEPSSPTQPSQPATPATPSNPTNEVNDEITSIALNKTSLDLNMPSTKTSTIKATTTPNKANTTLTWSTSDNRIAKVDKNGKITAVSPGKCTITVKTASGKTASCNVNVKFRDKNIANGAKVYFIDVNSADCILIWNDGKYGMIDTGTSGNVSRVKKYLKDLGVKELEWVMITHYDSDHMGGYSSISSSYKIKQVYLKKVPKHNRYQDVKKVAQKAGTPIKYVGSDCKRMELGNMKFNLYNLTDTYGKYGIRRQNINSIVAVATVNSKKIAFMGDFTNVGGGMSPAEVKIATAICDNLAKKIGKVDIYKIAHHGYNGNRSTEINQYKPKYAILTNNRIPNSDISKRIKKYTGSNFYMDGTGTVIMTISNNGEVKFNKLSNDT